MIVIILFLVTFNVQRYGIVLNSRLFFKVFERACFVQQSFSALHVTALQCCCLVFFQSYNYGNVQGQFNRHTIAAQKKAFLQFSFCSKKMCNISLTVDVVVGDVNGTFLSAFDEAGTQTVNVINLNSTTITITRRSTAATVNQTMGVNWELLFQTSDVKTTYFWHKETKQILFYYFHVGTYTYFFYLFQYLTSFTYRQP